MTTKDTLALALEALEMAKRWHKGDKWRNGTFEQRETWATAHGQLDEAITAIKQAQEHEPYGIVYEYDGCGGTHQSFSYRQRNGKYPDRSVKVFTEPAPKQAEPSWQPIESAPTDGTAILGCWPSYVADAPMLMATCKHMGWSWVAVDYTNIELAPPTYWLPLPTPPEAK